MVKRVKYQMGDIFTFEIEDGLKCLARVIKKHMATVFIEVYKIPPFKEIKTINLDGIEKSEILEMTWCYDKALKNGMWEIVGNIPVEENFEMPYFRTDDGAGKYYLIKGGETHSGIGELIEVTKEETQNAWSFGISNEIALPKDCIYRLRKANMYS